MVKQANYLKVYIIHLNYNGWQDMIECVVDNNSPNNSMEYIRGKGNYWSK